MTRTMRVLAVRHCSVGLLSARRLLQLAQAARRLVGSYQAPPAWTGVMWSTWVAMVVQPGPLIWQVPPSRWRICGRMRCQGPEYWGLAMRVTNYLIVAGLLVLLLVGRCVSVFRVVR